MIVRVLVVLVVFSFFASPALARNDTLDFSVEGAMSVGPKHKLLDTPWYMAGYKKSPSGERLQMMNTQKATNKFGKDDDYACSIAFMSAIIQLQKRAKQLGAKAVVDIKAETKGMTPASPNMYNCNLGTFTAVVRLTGVPVK